MSKEFLQAIIDVIDERMELKFPELLRKNANWSAGKVAENGSGSSISVYINKSRTAVDVKNPRSFSLTAGQLVMVISPNNKNDNMRYIDHIL